MFPLFVYQIKELETLLGRDLILHHSILEGFQICGSVFSRKENNIIKGTIVYLSYAEFKTYKNFIGSQGKPVQLKIQDIQCYIFINKDEEGD